MHGYFERAIAPRLADALGRFPVVAILGPRGCGKSTFVRHALTTPPAAGPATLASEPTVTAAALFLDLADPRDRARLGDPFTFFDHNADGIIVIDEVQRHPGLFSILRRVLDARDRPGRFVVLGSASPDLLRQGSDALADRVTILELGPLTEPELRATRPPQTTPADLRRLWLRGGFPASLLAPDDCASLAWRREQLRTFLERDLFQFDYRIPSQALDRLLRMLAHGHGQPLNASRLADSLGVSPPTVRSWLGVLAATFRVRLLPPLLPDLGKRLVKSPRVYLRDSGTLHALLDVEDFNDLLGHPCCGPSWEGHVIEHAIAALPRFRPHHYRTAAGAGLDLVLELGDRRIAVEASTSSAPRPTRGFFAALDDLAPAEAFVVAPVDAPYPLRPGVTVLGLPDLVDRLAAHA